MTHVKHLEINLYPESLLVLKGAVLYLVLCRCHSYIACASIFISYDKAKFLLSLFPFYCSGCVASLIAMLFLQRLQLYARLYLHFCHL